MNNREIKFRAWADDQSFIVPSTSFSLAIHDTGPMIQMWCSDGMVDEFPAEAVDQFTGLQDKNGTDIYEGDIVKYGVGDVGYCIEWNVNGQWSYRNDYGLYGDIEYWECEVIGNIHENPEFLV